MVRFRQAFSPELARPTAPRHRAPKHPALFAAAFARDLGTDHRHGFSQPPCAGGGANFSPADPVQFRPGGWQWPAGAAIAGGPLRAV